MKKYLHNHTLFHYILPVLLTAIVGFSAQAQAQRSGNEVQFDLKGAKLKIVVCDEAVMQVRYTLADTFSSKKKLDP